MMNLHQNSPDVYEQFDKGHVVLNESLNQFSVLALDQAHEHNILLDIELELLVA